jgi:hypothetical protein
LRHDYEIEGSRLYRNMDNGEVVCIGEVVSTYDDVGYYAVTGDGGLFRVDTKTHREFLRTIVLEHKQRDEILETAWYAVAHVSSPWEDKPVARMSNWFGSSLRRVFP